MQCYFPTRLCRERLQKAAAERERKNEMDAHLISWMMMEGALMLLVGMVMAMVVME